MVYLLFISTCGCSWKTPSNQWLNTFTVECLLSKESRTKKPLSEQLAGHTLW